MFALCRVHAVWHLGVLQELEAGSEPGLRASHCISLVVLMRIEITSASQSFFFFFFL